MASSDAQQSDSAFSSTLYLYFAKLEQLDFPRAAQVALALPCTKRLATALRDLSTCESLYFDLNYNSLERRLDSTARELEICLSLTNPLGQSDLL